MKFFFDTETTGLPKNFKAPVSDLGRICGANGGTGAAAEEARREVLRGAGASVAAEERRDGGDARYGDAEGTGERILGDDLWEGGAGCLRKIFEALAGIARRGERWPQTSRAERWRIRPRSAMLRPCA